MSKERHSVANAPAFQDKPRGGPGLGFIIVIALIAFVSGSIVTLAVTGPSRSSLKPAAPAVSAVLPTQTAQPTPTSPPASQNAFGTRAPNTPPGQTTGSITPTNAQGFATTPATSNPNIPNPEPWQYDPVANKHYHPDHGHWHSGKPPSQQQPAIANPEPWQYDPATNKFWHPGHNHWHDGQPPPPDQRQ